MSSMVAQSVQFRLRPVTAKLWLLAGSAALIALVPAAPARANDGAEWDVARSQTVSSGRNEMSSAISRWQSLTQSSAYGFDDYSGFLMAYPGWPDEAKLRRNAEQAILLQSYYPDSVVRYFTQYPPITNGGRARFALALSAQGAQARAMEEARLAWRGGTMADEDEAAILNLAGNQLSSDDHDARMDALLWAGAPLAAERQMGFVSPQRRDVFAARLATLRGLPDGGAQAMALSDPAVLADPGVVFNRARALRKSGQTGAAQALLAGRPRFNALPQDPAEWLEELLVNARAAAKAGSNTYAYQIASKLDDSFAPGTDISETSLGIRDDYTSLAWLAGTTALWKLGNAGDAAPMFYRYGAAAKTPQTRSKGFYWAGLASTQAGDNDSARRYFEAAAQYPDHFYGMLALERLGRPVPNFQAQANASPTRDERDAFSSNNLVSAARDLSRYGEWKTTVRFFRALADQANTPGEHALVADFARSIGRRDLAVILGISARGKGLDGWQQVAFPVMPVPPGYQNGWTMIHAITRQESQFAQNAISHAGARGLMQLMPATAREQAGKIGLAYSQSALIDDAPYNVQLGSSFFSRMLDYYNGSYPLAVASYNAGPGNVNKWLRANGDPRNGGISWVEWIEQIPLSETRNYVQRVLENAVVYDAMNPDKANYRGANPMSHYLGKYNPG